MAVMHVMRPYSPFMAQHRSHALVSLDAFIEKDGRQVLLRHFEQMPNVDEVISAIRVLMVAHEMAIQPGQEDRPIDVLLPHNIDKGPGDEQEMLNDTIGTPIDHFFLGKEKSCMMSGEELDWSSNPMRHV